MLKFALLSGFESGAGKGRYIEEIFEAQSFEEAKELALRFLENGNFATNSESAVFSLIRFDDIPCFRLTVGQIIASGASIPRAF